MSGIVLDWQVLGTFAVFAFVTAILSYISCKAAIEVTKRAGMIAQPGNRQSHQIATPTGGGLGLMFSIVLMSVILHFLQPLPDFWWFKMLPGILVLALIGWRDDRNPVSSLLRLVIQFLVSFWLLGFDFFQYSVLDTVLFAAALLALMWAMNIYNFMDGSNGMASFQGVFSGLVMSTLFYAGDQSAMAILSLIIAAACGGFLPLNFPHARVFMGDVASVPLGFIFASLAVYGLYQGVFSWPVAILIMSVFIVDATLTLLKRAFLREQWYTAHAQHIYQRLITHGWPHSRVLMVYQSINIVLVTPAIALAEIYPHDAVVIVGLILLLLGSCWQIANRRLGVFAREQVT